LSRYRIEWRPAAARALGKLDPPAQRRLRGAIALLAENPRPPASRPMVGRPGLRLRVGDYRVIYTVGDAVLLVVVVELGHRREVYDHSIMVFSASTDYVSHHDSQPE